MDYKVTTPRDVEGGLSKLDEALSKIESKFRVEESDQNYYHIVIVGEYNRKVCDKIEQIYTEAGWTKVKCRTSSENGERGGLTGLQLYRP